jgi:hypothetical protein
MNETMKLNAFLQGIMEVSAVQREALGTKRILPDGRVYRYARATATAIAPGIHLQPAIATANHINRSAAATPVGSVVVTFDVGATSVAEDMYKDGFLQVNAGTAGTLGTQYRIKTHTIVAAAGGSITVELADPLITALVASTDKLSLIPNPFNGASAGAADAGSAGIAPVAVPASYYFWSQTGGVAAALLPNASTPGTPMVPGATGALVAFDAAVVTTHATIVVPTVGYSLGTGVTANFKPIFLTLD